MTDEERQQLLDLIKQAKEGKQYAFTQLYNRYHRIIYNTIYNIVHNKDVTDDLVSVTLTKAFFKIASYINHISFEMWLKTIAINSSIDYIRRTKKEKYDYELDNDNNCLQVSSSADSSPEDLYIYHETDSKLSDALSRLRYKYRYILELRTVQNLSYKEIAEHLELSESQVKSRLNKAREKLKQLLN